MQNALIEMRALASRARHQRTETGIPRVALVQGPIPEHQLAAVYEPMVNVILRGSKSMTVGGKTLHYDPATYFVMSVGLPAAGRVHPEPSGAPYLAASLTLEPALLAWLADLPSSTRGPDVDSGFSIAAMTPELMDAWLRLLRLMDRPAEIPALAPLYEREILFRVLQGPLGWMLRDLAVPDTTLAGVNRAIQWIRQHHAEPLRVESLARHVAMSASAFHRHFKAVTALSPLQYQKRVRLLQARALLVEGKSVASVALAVGYASSSQFSREYGRLFGLPPARDADRILDSLHRRPSGLAG